MDQPFNVAAIGSRRLFSAQSCSLPFPESTHLGRVHCSRPALNHDFDNGCPPRFRLACVGPSFLWFRNSWKVSPRPPTFLSSPTPPNINGRPLQRLIRNEIHALAIVEEFAPILRDYFAPARLFQFRGAILFSFLVLRNDWSSMRTHSYPAPHVILTFVLFGTFPSRTDFFWRISPPEVLA